MRRIQSNDYATEADGDSLLEQLRRSVPDPEVSDLIFWRTPALSAEEIIDRAMAYEAITLPSPRVRVTDDEPPLGLLARLLDLLVVGDYAGAEALTGSVRVSADEMRTAISDYGGTLTPIPEAGWNLVDAVRVTAPTVGKVWSVEIPLWSEEEGRSDLEVRTTITVLPDGQMRIELDDILVP